MARAARVSKSAPETPSRSYVTTIGSDPETGTMTAISVPFDPQEVFGNGRAPVVVRLNGYEYRSTVFTMCGERWVPLRASHREAAGVTAGQKLKVTLTLDGAKRTVKVPRDLAAALKAAGLLAAFKAMSFTHQREHAEAVTGAKKAETRARRVAARVAMVGEKAAAKTGAKGNAARRG